MMKRNLFTVLMITLFLITLMTSCKTKKEEPADETGTEEITDEIRETETTQSGITDWHRRNYGRNTGNGNHTIGHHRRGSCFKNFGFFNEQSFIGRT